jgi:hypothetical protein
MKANGRVRVVKAHGTDMGFYGWHVIADGIWLQTFTYKDEAEAHAKGIRSQMRAGSWTLTTVEA